jgi:hypothetical protein
VADDNHRIAQRETFLGGIEFAPQDPKKMARCLDNDNLVCFMKSVTLVC